MNAAIRRIWLHASSLGLLACVCSSFAWASAAQETPKQSGVQLATQTPAEKLEAILTRFQEQEDKAYAEYDAAKTDEERAAAMKHRPGKEYLPELRDVATSARGTDTAATAWLWVLQIAPNAGDLASAKQALDVLLAEHLQSEKLVELPGKLRYASDRAGADVVQSALKKLVDGSPHATVKASALYTQAGIALGESATKPDKLKEAKEIFSRLAVEFADVPTIRGSKYGAVAERNLFELDHLQVGMVAPEFEAVDENGVAFKLSDYRGKVVVVDFWGFW
jgi:hypothetical protein